MAKSVILYKVGTATAITRNKDTDKQRVQEYAKADLLVVGTEDGQPKKVITNDEMLVEFEKGNYAGQVALVGNAKAKSGGYMKFSKVGGGQLPVIKASELFEKFPDIKKGVSDAANAILTKTKRTRTGGTAAPKAPKTDPAAVLAKMKAARGL